MSRKCAQCACDGAGSALHVACLLAMAWHRAWAWPHSGVATKKKQSWAEMGESPRPDGTFANRALVQMFGVATVSIRDANNDTCADLIFLSCSHATNRKWRVSRLSNVRSSANETGAARLPTEPKPPIAGANGLFRNWPPSLGRVNSAMGGTTKPQSMPTPHTVEGTGGRASRGTCGSTAQGAYRRRAG